MHNQFKFTVVEQSESSAGVILEFPPDVAIRSLTGKLIGPHCQFARTLPAEFSFSECSFPELKSGIITRVKRGMYLAQVIDPCYWTPELPFLYDLQLAIQLEDGRIFEPTVKVGLTRWESQRRNLRLENRRVVLRGASVDPPSTDSVPTARAANTALLVNRFDKAFCDAADQAGVVVCIDLRTAGGSLTSELAQLDFSTSVFLALINADQFNNKKDAYYWPSNCLVAQYLSTSATPEDFVDSRALAAFELKAGERPPGWLAMSSRPVIAIRRGTDYADLAAARTACDRLQAELAPEFDLAGYFVAP